MTHEVRYIAVVACREAGSGEARWWAALGVLLDGHWVGPDPRPPANRAGDYPREYRYEVRPGGGRYRSAGVHGVPQPHVEHVCSLLDRALVNPHCPGVFAEDNWIDGDLPEAIVERARGALAKALRRDAAVVLYRARMSAAALRASARALEEAY